jgi:hypothetical protein
MAILLRFFSIFTRHCFNFFFLPSVFHRLSLLAFILYFPTISQSNGTNVFCFLSCFPSPSRHSIVWVLPVISLILTNTVSSVGPKKKTRVGLFVFNPLCPSFSQLVPPLYLFFPSSPPPFLYCSTSHLVHGTSANALVPLV